MNCARPLVQGLSPRVRGKRGPTITFQGWWRSIPACAGEALLPQQVDAIDKVYPRVCGGSVRTAGDAESLRGLSPRVRGKRVHIVPAFR